MSPEVVLRAEAVSKAYGGTVALDAVDFDVDQILTHTMLRPP